MCFFPVGIQATDVTSLLEQFETQGRLFFIFPVSFVKQLVCMETLKGIITFKVCQPKAVSIVFYGVSLWNYNLNICSLQTVNTLSKI